MLLATGDIAIGVDVTEQNCLGEVLFLNGSLNSVFEVTKDLLDRSRGEEGRELNLSGDDDFVGCIAVVTVIGLESEGWNRGKVLRQCSSDLVVSDAKARRSQDKAVVGFQARRRGDARCYRRDSLSLKGLLLSNLVALCQRLVWCRQKSFSLPKHDMTVIAKVLTLRLQTKIIGKKVQKLSMTVRHRLKSNGRLLGILAEETESSLLIIGPGAHFFVELHGVLRVRNMVVGVAVVVDIECIRQSTITLQTSTLVVAFQGLIGVRVDEVGETLNLILDSSARAKHKLSGSARRSLIAC